MRLTFIQRRYKYAYFWLAALFVGASASSHSAQAQLPGLQWRASQRTFEIPFTYVNNFIIVDLYFENLFATKFIFDTGSEYTILLHKHLAELLKLKYDKTFKLIGSDLKTELTAYIARNVLLNVANGERTPILQDILVLEQDYFHFDEYVGLPIDGILGADVFGRFVVTIDYQKQRIVLHDPAQFESPEGKKNTTTLPLEINKGKPYLSTMLRLDPNDSTLISTKLLLDTGASLSLLLHRREGDRARIRLPAQTIKTSIGRGLGGNLEGIVGRIPSLQLSKDVALTDLLVSFQDVPDSLYGNFMNDRDGILGNQIWHRFRVTIDYARGKLFLQPNRLFKEKMTFDRSGLVISASGKNLHTLIVQYVVANSPAAEAGIRPGDVITRIGWWSTVFYSLERLQQKLSGSVGRIIKMQVWRNGQKINTQLVLRNLI